MSKDPDPLRTTSEAEAAYQDYLARVARGERIDFEAFCQERPRLAEELRTLHGRPWPPKGYGEPAVTSSLGEWMTQRYDAAEESSKSGLGAIAHLAQGGVRRYRLRGEVARGGMGAILRVWDEHLRRDLAMKVILGNDAPAREGGTTVSAQLLNRFLEEAQVTGQLDHPGVVPVHELGVDDGGQVYFTMRLVKGRDFAAVIQLARANEEDWTPTRALNTLLRVCETLAYAHSKGVVHRDIKPANLMVGKFGEAYVMDWGLAKFVGGNDDPQASVVDLHVDSSNDAGPGLTQHGSVLGTPCYMSPEQAMGQIDNIGPQSDVYSMGCVLYHLMTGSRPYLNEARTDSATSVIERVRRGPPVPVREMAPDVSPELAAICEKAMEREPIDRYPSMLEMGDDLRAFLEGRVVKAYETGALAEFRKLVRRNRVGAAAVLAAILMAIATPMLLAVEASARTREVQREQRNTQQAKTQVEDALEQLERQSYVTNLIAAASSLRDDELHEARRHLGACGEQFRGWEWRHLAWRGDTSLLQLDAHEGGARAVAFGPAGRRVVSGGSDGAVKVWDVRTGDVEHAFAGHTDEVVAVGAAEGERVLSFGSWGDSAVRLWDLAEKRAVRSLEMQDRTAHAFAVGGGGARVAYVSPENEALVMDPSTGQVVARLAGSDATIYALAFGPEDRLLAAGTEEGRVLVWEVGSGRVLHRLSCEGGEVHATSFHPAGTGLAAATGDGVIHRWSFEDDRPRALAPLVGHEGLVYDLEHAPDGAVLASGSVDRTVRVWSLVEGTPLAVHRGHEAPVRAVAFAADGAVLASASVDGTVRTWSPAPAGVIDIVPDAAALNAVAASADGAFWLLGAEDPGFVELRPFRAGASPRRIDTRDDIVTAVAVSRDGRLAAAAYEEACRVRVFDLAAGSQALELPILPTSATSVAFMPDGRRLVCGSHDEVVRVFDLVARSLTRELTGHGDSVTAVATDPGGDRVVSGSLSGEVLLWDLAKDGVSAALGGPERGAVLALAWSPDGGHVAAGTEDHRILVWDAATRECVAVLEGHEQGVTSVAFSPDGSRLVSGSADTNLRLWNARFGSEGDPLRSLLTLRRHQAPVTSVSFSGDGTRLVSTSSDGRAIVWETRPTSR